MKKAHIYINYDNIVVLQSYLDVVKQSLENLGVECDYVKDLENIDKKELLVIPVALDAAKLYIRGYHNLIMWQQGATADESFMRNQSKIRYWILNKIDLFAMKKSKAVLFVSDFMKKHYEKVGNCSFSCKSYVMPCFNEEYDDKVYEIKDYKKKIFTYVGSLEPWQCFEQTVALYKKIEECISDTFLKVLTFNVSEAKMILDKNGVKNYEVKCVPKEDVKKELLSTTYGFIIREDNMVNNVATPTKISSYMAAGVIPIFSSSLFDFASKAKSLKYAKEVNSNVVSDINDIVDFIAKPIDVSELKSEYEMIFKTYYGSEHHKNELSNVLTRLL